MLVLILTLNVIVSLAQITPIPTTALCPRARFSRVRTREDLSDSPIGLRTISAMAGPPLSINNLAEENFDDIIEKLGVSDCDKLYQRLEGLSLDDISKLIRGDSTGVDSVQEATNVFKAWINREGTEATRQAVITALEKSRHRLAKQNLQTLWGTEMDKFQEKDISSVINVGQLAPNDIHSLFQCLGLKEYFIALHRKVDKPNVKQQARRVLLGWVKQKEPTPTINDVLVALEEAGNLNAAQELKRKWRIRDQ